VSTILCVGEEVDVVDLRDGSIIKRNVLIRTLYEDVLPGTDIKRMYASLSCGFAVPLACLRHPGEDR
jgi:hypothetical protein